METITGFVDHIVFQNSENGYTVMILSTEGEEMTCVGMCKGLTQGENISAEGEYIEHPVYGRQFKIQSYETVTPTDRVGMERYLGSGAIRGVGEALSSRISDSARYDKMASTSSCWNLSFICIPNTILPSLK